MSDPTAKEDTQHLQLNSAHDSGHVSVSWLRLEGTWAALTCGSDGKLSARHLRSNTDIKAVENHGKVLNCMSVSPDGSTAAAVDEQHARTWSLPGLVAAPTPVTRFTAPVRCCCWSKDSSKLAAGGDDGCIKIIAVNDDNRVCCVLRPEGYVRGLAYDPDATYLAAAAADGGLWVWEVASKKVELHKKQCAPKIDADDAGARQALAWHPDGGQVLAVAGPDADVVLLERLSWRPVGYLAGGHSSNVNVVAFSPNGIYAATGDADGKVVVWMVDKEEQLSCRLLPGGVRVSSLAWHPTNNALLVGAGDGCYGVWAGPVPERAPGGVVLPSCWQPLDEVLKEADAAAVAAAAGKSVGDVDCLEDECDDEDDEGAPAVVKRRGLKPKAAAAAAAGTTSAAAGGDGPNNLDDLLDELDAAAEAATAAQRGYDAARAGCSFGPPPTMKPAKPQAPVHPGSTPPGGPRGRFLAYNRLGCVVSKAVDDHHVIEVSFHDTFRHRQRIPHLTDYFGFVAGSLGPRGVAYISKAQGQEQPSMLVYRSFESWSSGSDWTAAMPAGEDALVVAAGAGAVAVGCSSRLLRLYSLAGRQLGLISLPGQPVAALMADPGHDGEASAALLSSSQHHLAVVWAEGPPLPACNTQQLAYAVYDVSRCSQCHCGKLLLSPGSKLTWAALSREGMMATMDSAGVLRVRSPEWGGSWVPVLDAAHAKASAAADVVWPAWLDVAAGTLLAVVGSKQVPYPQVSPRPLITGIPLALPLAPADVAPADMEASALVKGLAAAHIKAAADAAEDPADSASLTEEVEAAQVEADKMGLRLFNAYLKAGRQARALELVGGLHSMRSIEGALKLANHHKLPALAERITTFIEERQEWEQQQQQQQQQQESLLLAEQQQQAWAAAGQQQQCVTDDDMQMQQDQQSQQDGTRQQQPAAATAAAAGPKAASGGSKQAASVFGRAAAGSNAAAAGQKRKPSGLEARSGAAAGANPFARKKVTK